MKQCVLLLTNKDDYSLVNRINDLSKVFDDNTDLVVLYDVTNKESIPEKLKPYLNIIWTFTSNIIHELGYTPVGNSILGNHHYTLMKFFRENPYYDHYWLIEDDVYFNGDWNSLIKYFANDDTDFLSTHIRTFDENPDWPWWSSLHTDNQTFLSGSNKIASFNPIFRISYKALELVHQKLSEGWYGHVEVILSTIIKFYGLQIKDLGGEGSFTPFELKNKFYTKETHSFKPLKVQDYELDKIYHPIKEWQSTKKYRKYCVLTAIGINSEYKSWLDKYWLRTWDLHMIVYDQNFGKLHKDSDFATCKEGQKLRLAYDYLKNHQYLFDQYDYFFIPDDDIIVDTLTINRVFEMMKEYNLKIAQPALKHGSQFTFMSTLENQPNILRYTNFIEMMVPCFSRDALLEVLWTFNENESGWGPDFHWFKLLGSDETSMAVLDEIPIQHLRFINRDRNKNLQELKHYMSKYNLKNDIREFKFITKD